MKILKRGKPPGEREYKATCYTCKTQIQFKQSEGKMKSDQRDGDYIEVTCPVCGNNITCGLFNYIKDNND